MMEQRLLGSCWITLTRKWIRTDASRSRLHLQELRGIVDTVLQSTPIRTRKCGGADV